MPAENSNNSVIHLILTRFIIEFKLKFLDRKVIYSDEYLLNGIRVMKKYLFPSLESQSCNNFTWLLLLGNKANITHVESLLNFNQSFKSKILYLKDFKNFLKDVTEGFNILITTRIDYDDAIYYDAVNDVRKLINIKKPIIVHGYNRGVMNYEINNKNYDFYYFRKLNAGVWSVFASLIINLNKVNDTYTIYDIGPHYDLRKNIINSYKNYGINSLNYEPAIFDSGSPKFIYVRQNYSGTYKKISNKRHSNDFDLNIFYGK